MRHLRTAVAIAAAFVGCAAAASAALASAEFKPAPAVLYGFTGKGGAMKLRDTTLGLEVRCTSTTLTGEIESSPAPQRNVEEVFIVYKGCVGIGLANKEKCTVKSGGWPPGEIKTRRLRGELGQVASAEAASEVGLDLMPEVGTILIKLEVAGCAIGSQLIEGSVIGEVTPTTLSTAHSLVFTSALGKQKIQKFVGVAPDTLRIGASEAVLTNKIALTFGEAFEV
jgi:hypothetical protein